MLDTLLPMNGSSSSENYLLNSKAFFYPKGFIFFTNKIECELNANNRGVNITYPDGKSETYDYEQIETAIVYTTQLVLKTTNGKRHFKLEYSSGKYYKNYGKLCKNNKALKGVNPVSLASADLSVGLEKPFKISIRDQISSGINAWHKLFNDFSVILKDKRAW